MNAVINYETVKLFAKEKWEERRLTDKFGGWIKAMLISKPISAF